MFFVVLEKETFIYPIMLCLEGYHKVPKIIENLGFSDLKV